MEWQKPQIISYSEEELVKELQVKAFSGQNKMLRAVMVLTIIGGSTEGLDRLDTAQPNQLDLHRLDFYTFKLFEDGKTRWTCRRHWCSLTKKPVCVHLGGAWRRPVVYRRSL